MKDFSEIRIIIEESFNRINEKLAILENSIIENLPFIQSKILKFQQETINE